jgi:hypothetical protein
LYLTSASFFINLQQYQSSFPEVLMSKHLNKSVVLTLGQIISLGVSCAQKMNATDIWMLAEMANVPSASLIQLDSMGFENPTLADMRKIISWLVETGYISKLGLYFFLSERRYRPRLRPSQISTAILTSEFLENMGLAGMDMSQAFVCGPGTAVFEPDEPDQFFDCWRRPPQ